MASLNAHLRQVGDHGRLGFHPACPVCCEERLAGRLPSDRLVSGRAPAVITAGVIAFSYASPAAVLAQDGGQDQVLVPDSATGSAPGADVVAGPDDADEAAEDPSGAADDDVADDTGSVDTDPVTDGDASDDSAEAVPPPAPAPAAAPAGQAPSGQPAPVAPQAKPLVGAEAPGSAAPSASVPSDPAASVPPVTTAGAPTTSAPSTAAPGVVEARDGNKRAPARKRVVRRLTHRHRHAPAAVGVRSAPVAPAPRSVTTVAYVAQQAPAAAPVVVRHAGRPAKPGDRVHVVSAGESLWSIAQDVLGAKATVADVARQVDRLWALNRERIGTGDRDLLPIGTRLVLR